MGKKDILLDKNGDLAIVNGDFAFGESKMQEVGIILQLKQGELKSDPILGANLVSKIRSVAGRLAAIVKAKKHLKRDGKNYEEIKNNLNFNAEEN